MTEADATGESDLVRSMAAAWGVELDDDRAGRLVIALARYRGLVAELGQLDLDEHEPGVADPAATR